MKEIQLTQGKVALVDDEDFEKLNKFKWCAKKGRNTYYVIRWNKGKTIYIYHEIMGKPPKGLMIDHEDKSALNNQKSNLRFVTNRQNQQNRINSIKISQYPGVNWARGIKRWYTRIQINGVQKHLGYFTSELDTFNTYKEAVHSLGEKILGEL